jgi:hypothetical protein
VSEQLLTPDAIKATEEHFANVREAFALLALINAEFTTDPMSVQCFDLRIVERVRVCVGKRVAWVKKNDPFFAGDPK